MKAIHLALAVSLSASSSALATPISSSSGCTIDESTLPYTGQIHYAFGTTHPSGSISSSGNTHTLAAMSFENGAASILESCFIGNFTNRPDLYDTYYSFDDIPPNGSSHYTHYEGTFYEGLYDTWKYASAGKDALIAALNDAITLDEPYRYPSNFSGGNLNRNDNFWTYFDPEPGLIDFVDQAILPRQSVPVPASIWLFGLGAALIGLMNRLKKGRVG